MSSPAIEPNDTRTTTSGGDAAEASAAPENDTSNNNTTMEEDLIEEPQNSTALSDNHDQTVAAVPPADEEELGDVTDLMEDAGIIDDDDDDDVEELDMEDEDDDEDDMMSLLPVPVRRRVEKLKQLHTARESITQDYLRERAALENKYNALCKPLYSQRADIIKGVMDLAIAAEKPTDAQAGDATTNNHHSSTTVGVPQFWVVAMGHMEAVAELVTEQDVDCLEHLINVTCDDFPDGRGFTLRFYFEPNEYFTDEVLTKTYEIPNLLLDDEPILKNVTGCVIHWKHPEGTHGGPGSCLTHTQVQKRQRSRKGKNAGQIRTVTKNERTESFFHFFNPPKMPLMEDMDEAEADAIEEAFDHDYDVAQAFRSHLVPKGVLWFTGEALDEEINAAMESTTEPDHSNTNNDTDMRTSLDHEEIRQDTVAAMEDSGTGSAVEPSL